MRTNLFKLYFLISLAAISFLSYDYNRYIKETNIARIEIRHYFELLNEAEKGYLFGCYDLIHKDVYCKMKAAAYVSKLSK